MNCEQIRELLEDYVLGALDAETQAMVEKHLATCTDCRRLADEYAEMLNRLPEAVAAASPLRPPASMKIRLMQAIAESPRPVPTPVENKTGRWQAFLIRPRIRFQQVGSVIVLLLLIFSFVWIARLNTVLAHEQNLRESLEHQTELIFEVVDSDQTTRRFLRPTEHAPIIEGAAPPYGKVFTRADMPYVVAMTGRLPQPPAGQVYNLWLSSDGRSELGGTLLPDEMGFGSLVFQVEENGPVYESAQLILQNASSAAPAGTLVLSWQLNGEN